MRAKGFFLNLCIQCPTCREHFELHMNPKSNLGVIESPLFKYEWPGSSTGFYSTLTSETPWFPKFRAFFRLIFSRRVR